jgi:hypothetical protein
MDAQRQWNHRPGSTRRRPLAERFWEKVDKNPNGCWLWLAAKNQRGYGVIGRDGVRKTMLAHRASYELNVGPIPDGKELDHLCRNPACVNPAHLQPVTHAENLGRGIWANQASSKKTHCPQGHPLSGDNLYFYASRFHPNGSRHCRACKAERQRRAKGKQSCQTI